MTVGADHEVSSPAHTRRLRPPQISLIVPSSPPMQEIGTLRLALHPGDPG